MAGQIKRQCNNVLDIDRVQFPVFPDRNAGFLQGLHDTHTKHINQTVSKINNHLFKIRILQILSDVVQCTLSDFQYGRDGNALSLTHKTFFLSCYAFMQKSVIFSFVSFI